jgi:hypothetical protein
MEGLFLSAWSTDTLTQGSTKTFYTLEDRQSDASMFNVYQDGIPNQLQLDCQPNGLVVATWDWLATQVTDNSSGTGSSVAADTTHSPFDTWSGTLTWGGTAYDITSLRLTMSNNAQARFAVMKGRYPNRLVYNLDQVTGQMTMTLVSKTRLDDLLTDATRALVLTMTSGALSQAWTISLAHTTSWDAPLTTDPERLQTVGFEASVSAGTKVTVVRVNA